MIYTTTSQKQNQHRKSIAADNASSSATAFSDGTRALLSEEIKDRLCLPPLESADPLFLFNRMFKEAFNPSGASEYITSSKTNNPYKKNFFRKFSYICFERGHLAASVLEGQGKMLLTAAVEKAVEPVKLRESKAYSLPQDIAGLPDGPAAFYDDCSSGAYSLVLDASKSASKAIEGLKSVIEKDNETVTADMKALEYILPFLSKKRELQLIDKYLKETDSLNAAAASSKDGSLKADCLARTRALKDAIEKLRAIMNKKEQFRLRFLSLLESARNRLYKFEDEVAELYGNAGGTVPPGEPATEGEGNSDEAGGGEGAEGVSIDGGKMRQ